MIKKLLRWILSRLKLGEIRIERVMAVPPSTKMLDGKSALVIGGSRGIGKEIARRLSQAGACVIVTGQNEEELKQVKEESSAFDYMVMDVSQVDKLGDWLEAAAQKLGGG